MRKLTEEGGITDGQMIDGKECEGGGIRVGVDRF